MNFIWYIVSLLIFTFIFWAISELFKKRIWFLELLAIILYVLLCSIGIAAITAHFVLKASHIWIYFLFSAFLCFNVNGRTILFRDEEFRLPARLIIDSLSVLFYVITVFLLYKSNLTDYFVVDVLIIALIFGLISKVFRRNNA